MTELEDDIARIARKRGVDPAALIAEARKPEPKVVHAPPGGWLLFLAAPAPAGSVWDMRYFDMLPPKTRHYLSEQPAIGFCAERWLTALRHYDGDEDAVIAVVEKEIAAHKGRIVIVNGSTGLGRRA